jgi:hypothetical protein
MGGPSGEGHRAPRGFNLVEVVLAVGLLAGVLLAIGSMLVLANRQIVSGRSITQATAIAQGMMEAFDSASFAGLYIGLGAAASETARAVGSRDPSSPIADRQAAIDAALGNGAATVTIRAIGPGTPTFGSATGIRLTVAVDWIERGRRRSVALSTARF